MSLRVKKLSFSQEENDMLFINRELYTRFTVIFTLIAFVFTFVLSEAVWAQTESGDNKEKQIEIPVGQIVTLETVFEIDGDIAVIGSAVIFRVSHPVIIDGETVIQAGAAASGEVTDASKRGAVGKAARIIVTVRNVVAVDGSLVPLRGVRIIKGDSKTTTSVVLGVLCCVLFLFQKGGKAVIPEGSKVQAEVAFPATVTVSK